jgi:hypothetical protein
MSFDPGVRSVNRRVERRVAEAGNGGRRSDSSAAARRGLSHACVQLQFPDEEDPEELAATLPENMTDGNVHIVIALGLRYARWC